MLLAAGALVLPACLDENPCGEGRGAVVLSPTSTVRLRACVDFARTEAERRQGLIGRPEPAFEEGLLIVFPVTGEVCITNADVPYAIDAVYVGPGPDEGTVVAVERGFPANEAAIRCHPEVSKVLELSAGVAGSVEVGDRLILD